jgi:L-ascorbate metabolism protein UlaG (beta-lactamase superfamily)
MLNEYSLFPTVAAATSAGGVTVCLPVPEPLLRVHYLGHSAFVLSFADGVSLVTDYGKSNSFGTSSPIYDLGDLRPDVVLYSHHDDDHDRGDEFPGATILDGAHLHEEVGIDGIVFEPIKTREHAPGDNTSFLIGFEELRILFAGDCQGEIVAIDEPAERERLQTLFPGRIDLLFLPIDWTRPIASQAADFVELLRPRTVIPMHYWTGQARSDFFSLLAEKNKPGEKRFLIEQPGRPDWSIDGPGKEDAAIRVVGLEPAPWPPAVS